MKLIHLALACCLFAPAVVFAGDGYVSGDVELRAGPDPAYPTVAKLTTNTPVSIQGCVKNWSWCDVVTASARGWVAGDFLEQEYSGHRAVVPAFGKQLGIPVVVFSFSKYWNRHYRDRPWYAERVRWSKTKPRYAAPMHHPLPQSAK
ncbi:MAG: SH3 domain-containing protein [Rudaea sp.]